MERFFLADRSDTAGDTLPARLVAKECRDAQYEIAYVDGVVSDHDYAGPERRAGRARVFVAQFQIELIRPNERPRGASEQHGVETPAGPKAASHVDHASKCRSEGRLVDARPLYVTAHAEETRAG